MQKYRLETYRLYRSIQTTQQRPFFSPTKIKTKSESGMQRLKILQKPAESYLTVIVRPLATSPPPLPSSSSRQSSGFDPLSPMSIIGKIRKFWYGSENPYNSRDILYEQMLASDFKFPVYLPRYLAKILYARTVARRRYVRHSERIRKLEEKIGGGVFKVESFQNRFRK